MVREITPAYYAKNVVTGSFNLIGEGFENIPADAVGVWSEFNDDPLYHRYSQSDSVLFTVNVETKAT